VTRRVVTGNDINGRSTFIADEELDEASPAASWGLEIWGSDNIVRLPADGSVPEYETYFPPPRGFRIKIGSLPPEPSLEERKETARRNPSRAPYAVWENDGSGMHTSETIDVGMVLDGEVFLELDDGEETLLRAGDVIVQNGTRHAWHNRTDRPCRMFFAMLGAQAPTATKEP
jgi:uncharacterized cupin superfamily protein